MSGTETDVSTYRFQGVVKHKETEARSGDLNESQAELKKNKLKPKTRFLTCWTSGKKTYKPPAASPSKGIKVNISEDNTDFT